MQTIPDPFLVQALILQAIMPCAKKSGLATQNYIIILSVHVIANHDNYV